MYLNASARRDDLAEVKSDRDLWRRVRRFNLPVQLAVAAAEETAAAAEDAAAAALLSLAPCRSGSPELFSNILAVEAESRNGGVRALRINPTLTFHAVDNLALSSLAITLGNRGYGLGLGGAPGQAWVALEVAAERLAAGIESEALVVAGEQDPAGDAGLGVALLFTRRAAPWNGSGRTLRLAAVERRPGDGIAVDVDAVEADAAAGLDALLEALAGSNGGGRFVWDVPAAHGDGRDRLRLVWEAA